MRGRVIAGSSVNVERREALGWAKLDLDFAPPRVVSVIARFVSQNILISQLHADLGRNVRQIIKMLDGEDAATSQIGNLTEQ